MLYNSIWEQPIYPLVGFPLVQLLLDSSGTSVVLEIMENRSNYCFKKEEEGLQSVLIQPHGDTIELLK